MNDRVMSPIALATSALRQARSMSVIDVIQLALSDALLGAEALPYDEEGQREEAISYIKDAQLALSAWRSPYDGSGMRSDRNV